MKIRTVAALFTACTIACQGRAAGFRRAPERDDRQRGNRKSSKTPAPPTTRGWVGGSARSRPFPSGKWKGTTPYLLHDVSDAMVLGDGRIVVANSGTRRTARLQRVGHPSGDLGRRGARVRANSPGSGQSSRGPGTRSLPGTARAATSRSSMRTETTGAASPSRRTTTKRRCGPSCPQATTRSGLILAMHDPHLLITVAAEVRDAEGAAPQLAGEATRGRKWPW